MLGDNSLVKPLVVGVISASQLLAGWRETIGLQEESWYSAEPKLEVWRFMLGRIYPLWPKVCVPSQCPSVGLPYYVFYR